jgi:hypothetical protein
MAYTAIREVDALDPGLVLAPERYDPRRKSGVFDFDSGGDQRLTQFVAVIRNTLSPDKADPSRQYLILDTGNASDGFISAPKGPVRAVGVGSAKKILEPGDVIISRLRPYLRQVGWVDPQLVRAGQSEPPLLLASTEFYVLRGHSTASIAFLVPFLLSEGVQSVLAASQEGGHHPRFPEKTLLQLVIPRSVLAIRDALSKSTEEAINKARSSEVQVRDLVNKLSTLQ